MNLARAMRWTVWLVAATGSWTAFAAEDFTQWQPWPADTKPAAVAASSATLQQSGSWAYLRAHEVSTDVEVATTVTIESPATQFGFFGASWSVWPDAKFGDQGFEAALLLRGKEDGTRGYRVQISSKLQEVALVRFPDGGYLRSVPCAVPLKSPFQLRAQVTGRTLRVFVDDQQVLEYLDRLEPALDRGQVGIAGSSSARVTFSNLTIRKLDAEPTPAAQPHHVQLHARKWLGGRMWIFDSQEPILLLPSPESSYINNVKLRPGYKPQLSWNSHWDTQNQGAYREATNTTIDVQTQGGGETLIATWRGKHIQDRFGTKTKMTVGFDRQRGTYTYDIESELEVFAGEPFTFRYGYDFEHHTPLDPFNWQYLVARKRGGELYHRPVYPVDPGPQNDLEMYHGLRVWYGRHNHDLQIAPAVEYETPPEWNRTANRAGKTEDRLCHTAVCAAFYDTGVAFASETAPPGTKLQVKYRYTGYPAEEARRLFEQSKVYESRTLDPARHYIFADEWPKLTFCQHVPMSQTWIYGRVPFMTGHNQRPTYELVTNCGAGSGCAMKLGPASFGQAALQKAVPLAPGRYLVTALVKSNNAHGPGGRMELTAAQAKTGRVLASAKHYFGHGTFDWQTQGFVWDVPEEAGALTIAFGNAGTGELLVTDVEFYRLKNDEPLPAGIAARPNAQPPAFGQAPAGAIADYRMLEGQGLFVFNHADGDHLALANLDWVQDEGRPALRFAENLTQRKDYSRDSGLGTNYLAHPGYAGRETVPVALSGHHGGGRKLSGLTLAAWIKPAAEMGRGGHGNKGDILGYGARRFILSLHGQQAPYQLAARINVNDVFETSPIIAADRWTHVALTAEPATAKPATAESAENLWHVRLYLNGQQVSDGLTKKFATDSVIPPSLALGTEVFYFHDAYYRGLIGRTLVFDRALAPAEIKELAH